MNTIRLYILLSNVTFLLAIIFFATYKQWILFRSPFLPNTIMTTSSIIQKKQIVLHYFHGDKWKVEKQELLWSDNIEKNIFQMINAWLILLDEERITAKKIMLQSALISTAGCVYLSFDHNVLNKEDPIFKKWMVIEGLLKTIVLNGIAISQVQFLVQHQQMNDAHCDFSLPWSIHGFIKK
jgi:hypothetical protein